MSDIPSSTRRLIEDNWGISRIGQPTRAEPCGDLAVKRRDDHRVGPSGQV